MVELSRFHQASKFFVANFIASLALSAVLIDPAVAVTLFKFNFDGTLIGSDPLGTGVTSQRLSGDFLLDADTVNNFPNPIAGRYDGAIQGLNLMFPSTPDRNAVTLTAADFPGRTNRVFVGARGSQEELQFLYGNTATQAPFFQPPSVGIIFTSRDLPLTIQLKEVLQSNSSVTFNGEFKLVLSPDQVETPNNSFFGLISINRVSDSVTPVPEPDNTPSLLLSLGFLYLCTDRIKGKNRNSTHNNSL